MASSCFVQRFQGVIKKSSCERVGGTQRFQWDGIIIPHGIVPAMFPKGTGGITRWDLLDCPACPQHKGESYDQRTNKSKSHKPVHGHERE